VKEKRRGVYVAYRKYFPGFCRDIVVEGYEAILNKISIQNKIADNLLSSLAPCDIYFA
jgi:hypothetical protein